MTTSTDSPNVLSPEQLGEEAAKLLHLRRESRKDILTYARTIEIPGKPLTEDDPDVEAFKPVETAMAEHHSMMLTKMDATSRKPHGRVMFFMPPGSAKALALDTPIPTPIGWKQMGDLQIGDEVFDETGAPCRITWISQVWRDRPVYRLRTDCGDEVIADHDHEWLVRLCGKRQVFKIKETWQLHRQRAKRPMIHRAQALRLRESDLPIDPYLLGVWLGDGCSGSLRITSSIEDQPWLRGELERLGYKTADTSVPTLFAIHGIRGTFNAMGLLNDPWHNTSGRKHIPATYLRAGTLQRWSLLQGLIDTDGTVCKKRGCATFCNTNRELAENVRELVRSLGLKAGWSEGRATLYGKDCGPVFRVSFYSATAARMPRKAKLCRDQHRTPHIYIQVEPAGLSDTVCIEVDSPSHLFLAGRSMTPTHNSTYASVVFPSAFLGRQPDRRLILGSYGNDLARKMGRRTRAIARQNRYQKIWGCGLMSDSSSAQEFALTNGSEYMAAGILSSVTGNRAHGIIIDDPLKGREDANSELIRQKTWEAYEDDLKTRLVPGGWIALVTTRWHHDDIAGRLLPERWKGESGPILCRDGMVWDVVCLQARCEVDDDPLGRQRGDYLWPEWFDRQHWDQFESVPRTWSALYQQIPSPVGGSLILIKWFKRYAECPPLEYRIITVDTAQKTGQANDYTVFQHWGVTRESPKAAVLLDLIRGKWTAPDLREHAIQFWAKAKDMNRDMHYGRIRMMYVEDKVSGTGLIQDLQVDSGVMVEGVPRNRDKLTEWMDAIPYISQGRVWIPVESPWLSDFLLECERLQSDMSHPHDDQIDPMADAIDKLIASVNKPMEIPDAALAMAKAYRRRN